MYNTFCGRGSCTRLAFFLCLGLCASPKAGTAQELERFVDRYAGDNGAGYLTPLAEVIGANLNSGFVRSARIEEGFHVRFELLVPSSAVSDDQRTFTATTDGFFTPVQTASVPTILGSDVGTSVSGDGGTSYNFPAGFELSRLGTAIPQVTVGSVAGTEATLRWMAFNLEDLGEFGHVGVGVRHSVSQYFTNLPADIAVGGLYQTVSLGDIIDTKAMTFGVHASADAGVATAYGGVMYETSTMDVNYSQGAGPDALAVSLQLDGHTGIRVTGGIELDLRLLRLRGDLSLGSQTVLGLGLSLGN